KIDSVDIVVYELLDPHVEEFPLVSCRFLGAMSFLHRLSTLANDLLQVLSARDGLFVQNGETLVLEPRLIGVDGIWFCHKRVFYLLQHLYSGKKSVVRPNTFAG